MEPMNPKTVRRRILTLLYERYLHDPLEMLIPEDFLSDGRLRRADLVSNMHYLCDRKLVEMMLGYAPPLFSAARITADGIDLVENRFEFNLRFPPELDEREEAFSELPWMMERLAEEAEFTPLDGEERKRLLRDVQYLRDEFARPSHRWRRNVIAQVLDWICVPLSEPDEYLPSIARIRELLARNPD
jgi:hypothetical protein